MPAHPHCHWRGTKDWLDLGLPMSTSSDEAAKMFDAYLTQMVGHFSDETIGGMEGCAKKMLEADPDYVMGHALSLGSKGMKIDMDYQYAQDIYKMAAMAQKPHVLPWERKHVQAVKLFAEGYVEKATLVWEDILVEHPQDIMAVKFLHDMYIICGNSQGLRDSCGRVVCQWKPSTPFYGDLLGMYAFGLEETGNYTLAEKNARKALDINRYDAWAAHCVAHIKEMTGQASEGSKFMKETESDWNDTTLECHNYWHWALFHVEKGDFETALGILDNHLLKFMKDKKSLFSVTDVGSLCFRLEAEGFDMGNRWKECRDVGSVNDDFHLWSFFDLNVLLTCVGSKQKEAGAKIVKGVRDFIRDGYGDIKSIYETVTLPVMEAMMAYEAEDYSTAVQLMKPLQYNLHKIGGSNAQRDSFKLFTIHAALQSPKPEDQKYANHLLMERKFLKGESPMADRLLQRLVISH